MSRTRRALGIGAAAALGVGALVAGTAGTAGAGDVGPSPELEVEKVVVGTAPADAEFVISVLCELQTPGPTVSLDEATPSAVSIIVIEDVTFGPEGGVEAFGLPQLDEDEKIICNVAEVEDGGADEATGPQTIEILDNDTYVATVENVFETADTTDTTARATTTSAAAAAGAARATPRFTG